MTQDYSCKKFSHTTYCLATIHLLHTTMDGQINKRTNNNYATSSTVT